MTITVRKLMGLVDGVNSNQAAAEGGLAECRDCVIRDRGVVETRPAVPVLESEDALPVDPDQGVLAYDRAIVAFEEDTARILRGSTGAYAVTTLLSTADDVVPEGYLPHAEARGNLYLGLERGISKLVGSAATGFVWAGVERPRIDDVTVDEDADIGWYSDTDYFGYRVVLRREDANGVIVRSAPSPAAAQVQGTGVAAYFIVDVLVPDTALAGDVVELYRTQDYATGGAWPESFFLAGEVALDSDGADTVTINDLTPDADLGRILYSTTTQQDAAYGIPGKAKVMAYHQNSMFLANTTGLQYFTLTGKWSREVTPIIAASLTLTSGSNLADINSISATNPGATLAIGQSITGSGIPANTTIIGVDLDAGWVALSSLATSTGGSLATAVNRIQITDGVTTETHVFPLVSFRSDLVYLSQEYLPSFLGSGYDTSILSGQTVTLRAKQGVEGTLQLRISGADAVVTGLDAEWTYQDFALDENPGLLRWSLDGQPEHFVIGRDETFVGDPEEPILSMVSAADRLYIFKTDGIWQLEGAGQRSGWRITNLSKTHILVSPRHACAANNHVYAETNLGVIRISTSNGIVNISDGRVRNKLISGGVTSGELNGGLYFSPLATEVHCITATSGALNWTHLVYNTQTDTWVEWTLDSALRGAACIADMPRRGYPGLFVVGEAGAFAQEAPLSVTQQIDVVGTENIAAWTDEGDGVFAFESTTTLEIGQYIRAVNFVYGYVAEVRGSNIYALQTADNLTPGAGTATIHRGPRPYIRTLMHTGDSPTDWEAWQSLYWRIERLSCPGIYLRAHGDTVSHSQESLRKVGDWSPLVLLGIQTQRGTTVTSSLGRATSHSVGLQLALEPLDFGGYIRITGYGADSKVISTRWRRG